MNTVQLECFLAVSDNLNFARAAEQLHITQPAVTHQINSLEAELDVRLFNRTTRTVELTEAGWNFIGDARNILNLTHSAKARLAQKAADHEEPFTIGYNSPRELVPLPEIIGELVRRHPMLNPVLKFAPTPVLRNHLQDGSIEVYMGFEEEKNMGGSTVYSEVARIPTACAVSPGHPLSEKAVLRKEDLTNSWKAVVCVPRQNPHAIVETQQEVLGLRRASETYFTDMVDGCLTLVKAGLGITVLPDVVSYRDPSLLYIPVEDGPVHSLGLYHKSTGSSPVLKEYIRLMKKCFETNHSTVYFKH